MSPSRASDAEPSIVKQARGARGMLGWSQADLAERSGVAARTVINLELGHSTPHDGTIDRIVAAFAKAGLEFFELNGGFGLFISSDQEVPFKLSLDMGSADVAQVSTSSTAWSEMTNST